MGHVVVRHVHANRIEVAAGLEPRRNHVLVDARGPEPIGASRKRLRRRRLEERVLLHRALFDRQHRLPRFAIQEERHAVGAHREQHLTRPAADRRVVEHERRAHVVFPDVVVHELIVPAHLAGLQLQRDDRVVEQVVARPQFAAPLRHRVPGFEVHEPEVRVHRRRRPDGAAAVLPDVAVLRPGVVARFAGTRHDLEVPEVGAGFRVEAERPAAGEVIAARDDRHHHAVAVRRRGADALRRDACLAGMPPHDLARLLADGNHGGITQPREQQPLADSDAPAAAERRIRLERPERFPRRRVERQDLSGGRRHEHAAVLDEQRRLRGLPLGQIRDPRAAEGLHVRGVDLRKGRVAGGRPVAARSGPLFSGIRGLVSSRAKHHSQRSSSDQPICQTTHRHSFEICRSAGLQPCRSTDAGLKACTTSEACTTSASSSASARSPRRSRARSAARVPRRRARGRGATGPVCPSRPAGRRCRPEIR